MKARGLAVAPEAAVEDGALRSDFPETLDGAFPTPRRQRCWVHQTLNALDKLPKSLQPNARKDLSEIWLSPNRAAAEAAMTRHSPGNTRPNTTRQVECLIKDRLTLRPCYSLPNRVRIRARPIGIEALLKPPPGALAEKILGLLTGN